MLTTSRIGAAARQVSRNLKLQQCGPQLFSTSSKKNLLVEQLRPGILHMQYAVRGLLPQTAEIMDADMKSGKIEKNFDQVLFCNIGNPQSVGQPPISFYREVMALVDAPSLLQAENADKIYDKHVIAAARNIASMIGSTGAYTGIQGVAGIRQQVATFLERRDGYKALIEDIYLTNGASSGINMMLQMLIAKPQDGVMIPIPQYPIYSALIALLEGQPINYYLDEDSQWSLSEAELKRSIDEARANGVNPRALVVINPGNPTGNLLSYDNIVDIVKFCHREGLVILADEVYQENVYGADKEFVSVRKVVKDLGKPYSNMEVASFHSTSKGIIGECGRRGGYMELNGFDEEVRTMLFKMASSGLCSNLNGQVMTSLMVGDLPPEGSECRKRFDAEYKGIADSLARKSAALYEALNNIDGVSCQPLEGAMYAFPKFELPPRAIKEAERQGQTPDTYYALSLLEHTGICGVPGSGFGQVDGTYHIRLTFLPEEKALMKAVSMLEDHHKHFMLQHT